MERKDNIKRFEEWFGVGDEGFRTEEAAKKRKVSVDEANKGATGEVSYTSEVKDRYGNGQYWVHMVKVVDYNHPDRLAAGL